ncbi:uncharacterized protein TNIN_139271 [Trichonephila inaurata madagascariensis]|uniref:TIL domain-containing protein n=1 Tax=Trichonephila inaurata madagascariensis TaxID=2747483 RepID=A0A8X7BX27_9ARAC|nr:uncharacterized protein TNIN_139271 [Trichonephila inaurata madagascariensis]
MKIFILCFLFVAYVHCSPSVTAPSQPLKNHSAVAVEHKFGGNCQGNKTYDYFADCGEHCKEYPKMCSSQKILRCGCKKGYIQIDLTYLSPCVKPEDCPHKSMALKEKKLMEKMEKHG